MRWGLQNLWSDDHEGGYAVRHGGRPARDFGPAASTRAGTITDDLSTSADAENFFEKAFPCMFPYGRGGIEAVRRVNVDFRNHVRWALQYHDRRFRKHETFPFVSFGMLQRREGLQSAKIQMRRRDFDTVAAQLSTLTVDKLKRAQQEEENGQAFSDPAVRTLRKHVHAVAGRVVGCDSARYRYRSQIWSTCAVFGAPSAWITINFSDTHDPIAQIFAGENIDMDAFLRTLGPDRDQRGRNIAADPYAAAKFFHFMAKTVFETLFKIKVSQFQVSSDTGVLGDVAAYFGTVESQGRGTLHLHMLLWLKNTPPPEQMAEMLKTEEFRAKVVAYIRANMRAYVPGLESAETVAAIPREKDLAYNRPPNPNAADHAEQVRDFEVRLARSEQVHKCQIKRCMFPNKFGRLVCKRKAPFELAQDAFVTEAGKWGPKRLFGLVNGWCPHILVNARCNNDAKLLTNGRDTKNITFYVTSYAAKKQGRNYNMSAVMAGKQPQSSLP
ncbi:helitron helicase-like domain-containing protein [Phanerochaete sordida]|uniref:Helitron helicase-like domain-containing protein n=1 Tax=Phanerochaete sordida TaxID=48140 RepID=A0A9P3GT85_9APHY|nr:helitron helicase-like domain-containing protein [Phanerochaete sordida]